MSDLPPSSLRGAVDLSGLVRRANAPAPSAPAGGEDAPADSSLVFETSDAAFQSVLELSTRVPVVVEFIAPGLASALGPIVQSYGGRLVLAVVDGSANPQLAQAFQVREVPAVAAVIAGRPVNLFLGMPSDAEVRQVLDELLQLATENGVTGALPAEGADPAGRARRTRGGAAAAAPPGGVRRHRGGRLRRRRSPRTGRDRREPARPARRRRPRPGLAARPPDAARPPPSSAMRRPRTATTSPPSSPSPTST